MDKEMDDIPIRRTFSIHTWIAFLIFKGLLHGKGRAKAKGID